MHRNGLSPSTLQETELKFLRYQLALQVKIPEMGSCVTLCHESLIPDAHHCSQLDIFACVGQKLKKNLVILPVDALSNTHILYKNI